MRYDTIVTIGQPVGDYATSLHATDARVGYVGALHEPSSVSGRMQYLVGAKGSDGKAYLLHMKDLDSGIEDSAFGLTCDGNQIHSIVNIGDIDGDGSPDAAVSDVCPRRTRLVYCGPFPFTANRCRAPQVQRCGFTTSRLTAPGP